MNSPRYARIVARLLAEEPLTSVEPLARLPNLEHLSVHQCFDLESIRPLASCPKLVSLDVGHLHRDTEQECARGRRDRASLHGQ